MICNQENALNIFLIYYKRVNVDQDIQFYWILRKELMYAVVMKMGNWE